MIKPSELTPAVSALLAKMMSDIFPPEEVVVVQGDVAVGRAFTALPFDHLVYTGSTNVGREVMRAAAEHLVPVTLELGGKSPVIVADDYDAIKAAQSIAVGKFFNAGQTCVSPDYALVKGDRAEGFARAVLGAAETMYPTLNGNPRGNVRHFPPTVVLDPPLDGRLMTDEIFGPVLPVVRVESVEAAVDFVNARPRPLALYAYTKDNITERHILDRTVSGGTTINGTMMHVGQDDLPFGGVGPSGMGAYHGREGFYTFSHARGVHKPGFISGFEMLKPPHAGRMRFALKALAGFDLK
jgi:coniferyl-aldehyde dehydrogenase